MKNSKILQSKPIAALWRIFSSNKSAPAYRKKGFYINRDPNKQEVGYIFMYEAAQNFEVFQIFKTEIKKSKTYTAVDVLFKAYPMVQLSDPDGPSFNES